ncbi:MAG: metal ABC transporter permease [Neomegalonema sp.]|nr:metal ABC transporter permease [Neomegalonema sp.]
MDEFYAFFGGAFMLRAALAGAAAAALAGPLGCFALWRRMAYLGDATAHAALLGVALGLIFSLPIWIGAFFVAFAVATGAGLLAISGRLAPDAALGALSHAALAIALVAVSLAGFGAPDLEAYLFTGDPLAASPSEIGAYAAAAFVGLTLIVWFWRRLLNSTLSPELAAAEGDRPRLAQIALMIALAIYVALAMRLVGLLLATALLILPAAAARPLSSRPEMMAAIASMLGVAGTALGLAASAHFDTPTGPSMVTALFVFFALIVGLDALRRRL